MNPLEPPDSFHLLAAHGWLELGCPLEANEELEKIAPALQSRPDVLHTRYAACASTKQWAACVQIGQGLVEAEPGESFGWINRAYALRRAPGGGVQAAYDALRPAADCLEDLEQVTFNLACYACQLGRIDEGREWLAKSLEVAKRDGRIAGAIEIALKEPDLEPLWDEVRKW